jgi:7-carboxy-7-deazaguanine synthase
VTDIQQAETCGPDKAVMQVSELFYSIQGESTLAGFPCAFIRLSGCNMRCSYCDSSYTWEETGSSRTVEEIFNWLEEFPNVMVEITGGEPLIQESVYPLMEQLLARDREVLLETSGSLSIDRVPAAVRVIMDIKCPGSGMVKEVEWDNLRMLQHRQRAGSRDEVKFVLSSEEDFFWAAEVVRQQDMSGLLPVLFSPVLNRLPAERLAGLILKERLPVRLQLQLHTRIWPGVDRGV